MVPGRISRHGRPGRYVADDAALRRHTGSGSDRKMVRQARLSREDRVIIHVCASRDADLRHDETVSTDSHIMRNLYQVIDLGTSTDHGVIEGAAVDGRVRTDFHVVFNHASANVRNRIVSEVTPSISEPGGSHPSSRVENNAIAEPGTGLHDRMR